MVLMSSLTSYFSSMPSEYILYYVVILCILPITVIGFVVSAKVNSTFARYNQIPSNIGMTAAEAARKMLSDNGINNVNVVKIGGNLTDNFDPRRKVISLSASVFDSTAIGAIAVACHEAGHAVQHEKKYVFSSLRLALVPVLNFSNRMFFPILFIGMIFGFASPYTIVGTVLVWIGVILFGLSALFALVTLPTEFNASSRAIKSLSTGYLSSEEVAGAKKVLNAAAMTYVVSFLLSLLQFLRFFAMLMMSRRNRD